MFKKHLFELFACLQKYHHYLLVFNEFCHYLLLWTGRLLAFTIAASELSPLGRSHSDLWRKRFQVTKRL